MKAQEIIARLKAEVKRQARSIDTATGDYAEGRRREQRIILSVLSDLEKECEEKPTTAEGLEKEIKRVWKTFFFGENGIIYDELDILARHFAQWGAEHRGSSETPKDLDESTITKIVMGVITLADGESIETMRNYSYGDLVIAGAKWQKEQMMKEAVEGEVCGRVYDHINVRFADGVCKYLEPKNISHIPADVSKYNIGQKVKLIIVKED